MHPFVNNDPTNSLTDNIISRHFNQSLSSELFNLHPQIKSNGQPNGQPDSYANQNGQQSGYPSNEFSQNYPSEHQPNANYQIDRTNQNYESDYQLSQTYRNETLLEETIFNKHDKIRQLIDDCELMNNNNINNFVNYSSDELHHRPLDSAHQHHQSGGHPDAKLVSSNKCNCKCHCANHKKRNPFHLTNKLLHSLAKIKLNSSSQKSQSSSEAKRSDNNSSEDYNSFAPSLSNYSLSSSSSISSQTVSVSSYSSAPDNYGHSLASGNLATVLKRPVRKPPLPPLVREGISQIAQLPKYKPPAELPASAFQPDCFDKPASRATDEHSAQNDPPAKRSSNDENHYERVITKSFENLLIGDIKDSLGQRISLEERLKERPISSLFGRSEPFEKELKEEESIYETIGSDYDLMDEESFKDCFGTKSVEEEDLYQDIDLLDEEIYESLPNEFNCLPSEETSGQQPENETAVYANDRSDRTSANPASKHCESELDRKLRKQQKALDKKREIRAEKLRRKFNFLGNEVPMMSGIVKKSQNGNSVNLTVNKGEVVLILRIHDNPSGMWLAKDERSKIGYISNQLVEVDLENYKSLMNEPTIF